MTLQDFASLARTGLLREVEEIVVAAHRDVYGKGKTWSRPTAYQWLRYEDAAPMDRLLEGVERLRKRGANFGAEAVDKACAGASKAGYLN